MRILRATTRASLEPPQPEPCVRRADLVLEAPFLSDADKETILSGNLRRLLRIAA